MIGVVLESTYHGAFLTLKKILDKEKPAAIVSTGLASAIHSVHLEMAARNRMNGKYPDANGFDPKGVKTLNDGPVYVAPNVNSAAVANHLQSMNIPVELSADAGEFICESLLYLTSHYIKQNRLRTQNTFFHIPWTDTYRDRIQLEEGKIFMPEQTVRSAIEETIRCITSQLPL